MAPSNTYKTISQNTNSTGRPLITTVAALLLMLVTSLASATTQRMLLPRQSFTVPSGGTADAKSYCLDQYAKEPAAGTSFKAAPAALADVSVAVPGKGTLPLQTAIDKKFVQVLGNGGFKSLTFRNLTGDGPITVSIKRNSVVLPKDNAATDDIVDLPQFGSPGQPTLSQQTIWQTRAERARAQLGQLPAPIATASAAEDFNVTHDSILALKTWTKKHNGAGSDKTFVLQRASPFFFSEPQPLYILYKPDGTILTYEGNGNLRRAAAEIKQTAGTQRPRVVLVGDGDDTDFDAARLTMETAAGGKGPGAPIIGFEPPSGAEPPGGGNLYRGGSWESLMVAKSDGRLSATQSVFKRGTVTVYSKTEQLLGRMAAAVRQVTRDESLAKVPTDDLIAELRESIKSQVLVAMTEDSTLRAREGTTPAAQINIDKSRITLDSTVLYQKFTDLQPAVQPDALQRVAINTPVNTNAH